MPRKASGPHRRNGGQGHKETEPSLGGFLGGLGNLLEKLGDLAEKGKELHELGEFKGSNEAIRGVYGFTIRTGLGGEQGGFKVEPFGNVHTDDRTGRPVVSEDIEPMVDVYEEPDHVMVVAEMPGVGSDDVRLELHGDLLTIAAAHGRRRYHKEVRLPRIFPADGMSFSCRNGIVEIKFKGSDGPHA